MSEGSLTLRPEAGLVPVDWLTECQKQALHKIVASLDKAKILVTQSHDQKGIVDPDRVSRLLFVSGEPGSGKSSLFMTLRDIIGSTALTPNTREKHLQLEQVREAYIKEYPALERLDGTTLWLEHIDLEVAGEEGENLLAAVLVRILAVLDNKWSAAAPKACQYALDELNQLGHDIGIAWEGNLKERATRLDPESYSMEVMSAQRSRLHTNQRLNKALDTLARENCCGCKENTLFVLPIDDFYLKPAVSLELLRLLRMISVPRLFFLIMGDLKTMEALFLEKALADWTAVAGPEVFGSLGNRKKQEVLSRAREMSRRYLRKLLPVGQRAMMNEMTLEEALNFRPTGDDSGDDRKLWKLLDRVEICWKCGPNVSKTLCNFLIPPTLRKQVSEGNNGDAFNEYYSALQILEAMPREVLDLWMVFDEFKSKDAGSKNTSRLNTKKKSPPYLDAILDIVLRNLEEQDFLTESRQETLRFAFPTGYDAGIVRTDMLNIMPKVAGRLETQSSTPLFLRQHFGWAVHVAGSNINEACKGSGNDSDTNMSHQTNGAFSHLPPRQTSWIILLHDLSVHWRQEQSITTNLVKKLFKTIEKGTCCDPTPDQPGWAWYRGSVDAEMSQIPINEEKDHIERGQEETDPRQNRDGSDTAMITLGSKPQGGSQIKWFHFPFPEIETFRQLDCLLEVWDYGLRNSHSKSLNRTTPLNLWIRACWIASCPEDRYQRKFLIAETMESPANFDSQSHNKSLAEFKKLFFENHQKFCQLAIDELAE